MTTEYDLPKVTPTDKAINALKLTIKDMELRIMELQATQPQAGKKRKPVRAFDPRKLRRE